MTLCRTEPQSGVFITNYLRKDAAYTLYNHEGISYINKSISINMSVTRANERQSVQASMSDCVNGWLRLDCWCTTEAQACRPAQTKMQTHLDMHIHTERHTHTHTHGTPEAQTTNACDVQRGGDIRICKKDFAAGQRFLMMNPFIIE